MEIEELIRRYPRLYHMAEAGVWPMVEAHGLLSTARLLDLFEVSGAERGSILGAHRPESVDIRHPTWGLARVRDQKPMSEGALRKCLRGVTPAEWFGILNSKVYFWLTEARVRGLLGAKAYRGRVHTVLTVETGPLVRQYEAAIRLSPINSGSTVYDPRPRGPETFRTIAEYPYEERRRARGVANAIAELTVEGAVPDVRRHVIRAEHRVGEEVVEVLYERGE